MPALPAPEQGTVSEVYDYFQQGRRHLQKGMAAQATVPLEKAKRREPNKASILDRSGSRTSGSAGTTRPLQSSARSSSSPEQRLAHYALGRCLEKQGHAAEANGHYNAPARCDPARSSTRHASATSGLGLTRRK